MAVLKLSPSVKRMVRMRHYGDVIPLLLELEELLIAWRTLHSPCLETDITEFFCAGDRRWPFLTHSRSHHHKAFAGQRSARRVRLSALYFAYWPAYLQYTRSSNCRAFQAFCACAATNCECRVNVSTRGRFGTYPPLPVGNSQVKLRRSHRGFSGAWPQKGSSARFSPMSWPQSRSPRAFPPR